MIPRTLMEFHFLPAKWLPIFEKTGNPVFSAWAHHLQRVDEEDVHDSHTSLTSILQRCKAKCVCYLNNFRQSVVIHGKSLDSFNWRHIEYQMDHLILLHLPHGGNKLICSCLWDKFQKIGNIQSNCHPISMSD